MDKLVTSRSLPYRAAIVLIVALSPSVHGQTVTSATFAIVDTGQSACYDDRAEIPCPAPDKDFFGQDAQYGSAVPAFTDNGDGTITDDVTGLMWQRTPDTDGDGKINAGDKLTHEDAVSRAESLDIYGYDDWRLPTIKELYSLIDFRGIDPSGFRGTDTSNLTPFIDRSYFDFAYGDTSANERIIDAQYASSSLYVATTGSNANKTLFGVNFADGRIKGYGLQRRGREKAFFVMYVRGGSGYGENDFTNNGDGTVTDQASGLMWSRDDNKQGVDWKEALAWVQARNAENYLGNNDWRLPNAKELQGLVDYSRSPETTDSAAIDPLFFVSEIEGETGQTDYPAYWSSTTHLNYSRAPGANAVYVNFGRALGHMNGEWVDIHGAGAQRSDPKLGSPDDFPTGRGPQGDAIRIYNYVRLVRDTRFPQ